MLQTLIVSVYYFRYWITGQFTILEWTFLPLFRSTINNDLMTCIVIDKRFIYLLGLESNRGVLKVAPGCKFWGGRPRRKVVYLGNGGCLASLCIWCGIWGCGPRSCGGGPDICCGCMLGWCIILVTGIYHRRHKTIPL